VYIFLLMTTIKTKLAVLIALPLMFQIGMAVSFGVMLHRSEQMAQYEFRSKEVIGSANWLNFVCSTLALCWIGSVATRDVSLRQSYDSMSKMLPNEIRMFTGMYESDDKQKQRAERLASICTGIAMAAARIDAMQLDGPAKIEMFYRSNCLQALWSDGAKLRTQLLEGERGKYSANLEDLASVRDLTKNVLYGGLLVNIILAFSIVLYYGRTIGQRIGSLTANAQRLVRDEPLSPALPGNDEVALLDDTFHKMAQSLKEAAQKERAIVDNAVDLICALDGDGNFLKLNPACETVLGSSLERLKGTNIREYLPRCELAVFESNFDKVLKLDQAHKFECQFQHDGGVVDLLWSMRWVAHDQSIFCVAHDLTERKKVERLRQDLMAMVSHDIRTPLTTITGCLDFLTSGYADSDGTRREKMLNVAQKCCNRVVALTSDLLDLDKIDSGMLQIQREQTPLQDIFDDAEDATRELADEKSIQLVVEKTDLEIYADRNRILQVMVNLVSNAIKFTPAKATVSLFAKVSGGCVRISVVDQGRGIPSELQSAVFDRFRQVESNDSSIMRGTGLGLAICKALVEAHGGRIWCTSELGKGSEFNFEIPSR
jgi:PAS domain S-box-containing protein